MASATIDLHTARCLLQLEGCFCHADWLLTQVAEGVRGARLPGARRQAREVRLARDGVRCLLWRLSALIAEAELAVLPRGGENLADERRLPPINLNGACE